MDILEELAKAIRSGQVTSRDGLERLKRRLAAETGEARVPTDADILARVGEDVHPDILSLLRTKPSRSLSGVAVVAIMAPPTPCPHGRCAYCPGGVDFGTPQSYTGREPAALRAGRAGYDASLQTTERLGQLEGAGHPTDKVELVIMGGTFPAVAEPQRSQFIRAALDVLTGSPSISLEEAIRTNEGGRHRCVALTVETRPDLCNKDGTDDLLSLGATRVEIGVQTTEDRPLELVGRGHGVSESVEATRNLKDGGLKVGYHMMLGLPGMTPSDDLRALERAFEDPAFRPDLLKLYPTLVMPGTELHRWWERGDFKPIVEEEAIEVLARLKPRLPPWVRISRVERDIPSNLIASGIRASNLRQLVATRMTEEGTRCGCIRCREVGRLGTERVRSKERRTVSPTPQDLELGKIEYQASEGREAFLSLDLPGEGVEDALVAYARVRWPSEQAWRGELEGAAVLREIRVLGEALPLGEVASDRQGSLHWQHRGLGGWLLKEVEGQAAGWGMNRLAITSGMGARGYFRKRGYSLTGPYMVKDIS
jgi:elongator complex protein 3